jgi:dTDP-4-amino-4,6-dideoxygalactose transaminase
VLGTDVLPVPFLDLRLSHAPLRDALLEEIRALIDSGAFTNGPHVREFEEAFAVQCGTAECVGVASGLDALRLALLAAEVGDGAEVIVPAMTFVATLEAVAQAGAVPVLVDVSEVDYALDAARTRAAVGPSTRAIMPVHLYGQLCDMRPLADLAGERGLAVVEDACQAHGAARDGARPGERSLAAAFSFYPGKNLGAMGDAGAVVTNDVALAARVRALREHGQTSKYVHSYDGYTSRLDTIQALVLARKLPHLAAWNESRRLVAARYGDGLAGVGDLVLPRVAPGSEHVWHLYVVRTRDPQALGSFLAEREIVTGRHYPEPPHLSAAWRHLGYGSGDFPVAEALARECLSLPIFPGMTEEQTDAVVSAVRAYFGA